MKLFFFKIYFTDYSDHCHVYRISNELNARLLQEGWVDKVKDLTKSEMNINESTNFTQILSTVEPKALEMVSDSTKETVLKQIREFLEEIVDTQ
ncbi:Sus1p SPAR_B02130 [Saccharomyces paradoxus]|uniref:Transcription and mRNA export factor SUS1 n=1 Tax=Saccharomyces paradoxus TaxID=27291 RepID=A0A8B8UM34_SACPA|nr:uncharacterized protein SPAR_B02130 [Saccharomyces paradoxus]QHS71674.1 hypothetical protein SPAR_B02130 [Saccharomyces paradoxus]